MTELDRCTLREKIELLEAAMFGNVDAQVTLEPTHTFCKGLYARSLFIPAGVVATGKIHKHEHLFMVAQGDVTVWTEEGMQRVQAPYLIQSFPGTKRAALAHTDSLVLAFHPTELTDLEELEAAMVCRSHAEFLDYQAQLLLMGGA